MSAYRELSVRGEPRADWDERGSAEGRAGDRKRRRPAPGGSGLTRILFFVFLALVAVTSLSAFAIFSGAIPLGSTERAGAQPATQTAVTAAQPTDSQPPAAQQAAAQAKAPVTIKEETFGDWVYSCQQAPESKEIRCSMAQQIANADTRQAIFLWRLTQDGKGGLVGIWRTPVGVLLSRGITLDAGTEKPIAIPYQTCGNGICQAVANLAPDFVETLSKSEKATATVFTLDGKGVNLALSVNGLAKGLAELRKPPTP